VSEANGYRSRDQVTVASTPALVAGQVLGKITAGAAGSATAQAGNTGNATVGTVTKLANVQVGTYNVEFISATEFLLIAPDGTTVGNGFTGTLFNSGSHLSFTITAGGTPMVVGDGFTIAIAAGSGKYAAWDAAAIDGSAVIAGILFEGTAASYDGIATIINADAEVVLDHLTPDDADAAVIAGLAALGIKAR
jgi:hypothetical protein